jgi:hypothetical protein
MKEDQACSDRSQHIDAQHLLLICSEQVDGELFRETVGRASSDLGRVEESVAEHSRRRPVCLPCNPQLYQHVVVARKGV